MWTWSRAISLIIALWYVIFAIFIGDAGTVIWTALFCLVPLACIWFPRPMAQYRGLGEFPKHIDTSSPPSFIFVMGWVVLFLPVLEYLLVLYLASLE